MRVLIATDAWRPQVNGVVTTLTSLAQEAPRLGAEMAFLTPEGLPQFACPGYPEIRLAWPGRKHVAHTISRFSPDYIHIATEGPIGWAVRNYCLDLGLGFTTSFHTRFPEYARKIAGIPIHLSYRVVRWFHRHSSAVMVSTASLERELSGQGFPRLVRWSRGVDENLFKPRETRIFGESEKVFLFVGRVSREKNLEAFLDLDLPGRKVVVGDGPYLTTLRQRYPNALFTGRKSGSELADCYASADVFVFPSRTDTFGLVLLEAMASGLPIAAYPVTGPIDIVEHGRSGILDEDLGRAARIALSLDGSAARACARNYTWTNATRQFLENIATANPRQASARPPSYVRSSAVHRAQIRTKEPTP